MSVMVGRRWETLCLVFAAGVIVVGVLWSFRQQSPDYKALCGPGSAHQGWVMNVSGGREFEGRYHWSEGGLEFPPGTFWSSTNGSVFGCPCAVKPCLRICCGPQGDVCRRANTTLFTSEISHLYLNSKLIPKVVNETHFYVFLNWNCQGTCFPLKRRDGPFLQEDGTLFTGSGYLDQSQFCVKLNEEEADGDLLQVVVDMPRRVLSYDIRAYAMLISVPFMITTLLVYMLLPSLRTLPGLMLMCYLTCLTLASLITGCMHLYRDKLSDNLCTLTAFAIQFAYLGYYFWLNIVCFDIWRMFSDLSSFRNSKFFAVKESEKRRFLLYSCYGWGGPLLITITTLVLAFLPVVPPHYGKPHLGPRPLDCWFYDDFAAMIYFFLPAGLLLDTNLLFFLFTTYSMWKQSSQVKKIFSGKDNQSASVNRTRFNHYIKLFLTMGLGTIAHTIFFAFEKLDVYYLSLASDLYNGLQGLPIFIVFTCNYRTLRLLRAKFKTSKHQSSNSSDTKRSSQISTQQTNFTNISTLQNSCNDK